MQGNLKSQTDDLMETKEEKAQVDAQSWISSKNWMLFSEEEIKQYAQHLINENDLYDKVEEFYRQPDYLLMLDEAGRTKLVEVIIKKCLQDWDLNHGEHSSHVRAVAGQVIERIIETEEQRNDIVDQLFKSINDEDDSSVSGLRLISEMPDTLRKLSEARQQQIVERIITIIKAGDHEHVIRIVDVISRLSVLLPGFDKNRQEICTALKKYAEKDVHSFIIDIAKIMGDEVPEEIKKRLTGLRTLDYLSESCVRKDLEEVQHYLDGIKWLLEGRISEEEQKEIISSLMEKITKKDDTRIVGFAKACHVAAIVLPQFSRFLSSEEKQEVADYSIGEFFSLMQSEEFKFKGIPIQMVVALMEEIPEYMSGREQDILKQLVLLIGKGEAKVSPITVAVAFHRFSAFLPGLSEDELQIMDWLLQQTFLPNRKHYNTHLDSLAKAIPAIGACIKEIKPELATQWLEKTIDTLFSRSVDKFAFADLITACLDGMTNEKKKHFLNYMHSRFLEVVGKGKKMKEKNFMGGLLMISADCERKQNILRSLGVWATSCSMFTDINLLATINRLSDGALSGRALPHVRQ